MKTVSALALTIHSVSFVLVSMCVYFVFHSKSHSNWCLYTWKCFDCRFTCCHNAAGWLAVYQGVVVTCVRANERDTRIVFRWIYVCFFPHTNSRNSGEMKKVRMEFHAACAETQERLCEMDVTWAAQMSLKLWL